MGSLILFVGLLLAAHPLAAQTAASTFERPVRVVDSIPSPESVAVGPDGAWYVSSFGKFGVKGDGAVYRVQPDSGSREVYALGLDDPCGLLFLGSTLWVADRQGVYRVTPGKVELVYPASSFPRPLHFLNDLAAGPGGALYVSDTGDSTASGRGAVFILAEGKRPALLPGSDTVGALSSVNGLFRGAGDTTYRIGLAPDGAIWYTDYAAGYIGRFDPKQRKFQEWLPPTGAKARPYAMAIDDRTRVWFVDTGAQPNRLMAFDPQSEKFVVDTELQNTRGAVRHMVFNKAARALWFGTDTNDLVRVHVP